MRDHAASAESDKAGVDTGGLLLPAEVVARKTVYFVRHGKAEHNVVEEQVKERAAQEARAMGYAEGDSEFSAHLKTARLEALGDERLCDPGLCDEGRRQAVAAQKAFESMETPRPTAVLVSPLFRTLETAAAVFPGHEKVLVCDVLRERVTGLPCDKADPSRTPSKHFPDFSFDSDLAGIGQTGCGGSCSTPSTCASSSGPLSPCGSEALISGLAAEQSQDEEEVEDAAALRRRTSSLADLLGAVEDDVVCVVTHKGWLRECERGPLGRPQAKEYKPCEVRAFEVTVFASGAMEAEPVDFRMAEQ